MRRATEHNDWDAKYEAGPPARLWIRLPYLPPSLNVWSRQHWSKRHREIRDLTEHMMFLAMCKRVRMFRQAEVRVTYYFRDRRKRDPDNYTPKGILDALRHAGILADDDAESISLPQPEFRVDSKMPRTEIVILEVF